MSNFMAFRRILSVRSTLLARRFNPSSFTYITHHDDGKTSEDLHSSGPKMETFLNQRRSLGCYVTNTFRSTSCGLHGYGLSFKREISTSMSEVAIAAANSAFPVAAVQYLIGSVHSVTGLNWWASIAIATLLVRGAQVPLYKYVLMKHSNKLLLMLTKMRMIMKQRKAMVSNMAEKVPSFKTGGTLWFTDLSTPDSMYIFPIFVALLSPINLELSKKNPTGDPDVALAKRNRRVCIALWTPVTMFFPNALFCYWITSNMFTYVVRIPTIEKALGVNQMVIPAAHSKSSTAK